MTPKVQESIHCQRNKRVVCVDSVLFPAQKWRTSIGFMTHFAQVSLASIYILQFKHKCIINECSWSLGTIVISHMWVNKYSKIVYVDGGNGDVMSWRHRGNVKLIQAVQELSVMWSYLVCANTVEFYWWSLYLSSISGKFSWIHPPACVYRSVGCFSISDGKAAVYSTWLWSIRRMLSGEFSETESLPCLL